MSALEGLWLLSLILAVLALAIMAGLLVGRAFRTWRGTRREAVRRRLIPLLLGGGGGRGALASRERQDLLATLSVELIQMVRGREREAFIENATRLGVPERLRHHLGSGSARTRQQAAEALSEFGDDRSIARLEEALDDPNPDVRLTAALALAPIGRLPSARRLVDQLGIGTTEHSLLVVSLFREIAGSRSEELKALLYDPTVPSGAKAAAIDALSASPDYSLVPLVSQLALRLPAEDPALPRYLRALAGFGHPAGAPAIDRGLASEAWAARAAAAHAAGKIGLTETAARLAELLDDENWWVRFRAGEALSGLGPEGKSLLVETARTGPDRARTAAALTLAERSGPE